MSILENLSVYFDLQGNNVIIYSDASDKLGNPLFLVEMDQSLNFVFGGLPTIISPYKNIPIQDEVNEESHIVRQIIIFFLGLIVFFLALLFIYYKTMQCLESNPSRRKTL